MNNEYESLARQIAQLIAGTLVADGLIDASVSTLVSGAIMSAVVAIFAVVRTRRARQKLEMTTAEAVAAVKVAREAMQSQPVASASQAATLVDQKIQAHIAANGIH